MAEKILVVDDDLDTLRLVGLMLERQGYRIMAASSGQQALSMIYSEKPDLVLLDLMMPEMDGIEVARRLRASPETAEILIIMFTAKSQIEDKLEGFDAGADDYLTKPTQPRELIAHVKAVLKRSGMRQAAPEREYKDQGKLIGVLAAKGGVGVSTLALNLGVVMHQETKRSVLVSDFRPGCGTIGLEVGVTNPLGLSKLLAMQETEITPLAIERELFEHHSGVQFLLASAQPLDARLMAASEQLSAIARQITYLASYTILDLGGAYTPAIEKVLQFCDRVVVVVEPVPQTVYQTRLLLDCLGGKDSGNRRVLVALVNRLRAGMQLSLGQVQDQLGRDVSVIFTAAPELAYQSQVSTTPMVLRQADGVAMQQFTALAAKVIGKPG
jgi:pilus assembly protein CpaE